VDRSFARKLLYWIVSILGVQHNCPNGSALAMVTVDATRRWAVVWSEKSGAGQVYRICICGIPGGRERIRCERAARTLRKVRGPSPKKDSVPAKLHTERAGGLLALQRAALMP
jgi:hypothetical protein